MKFVQLIELDYEKLETAVYINIDHIVDMREDTLQAIPIMRLRLPGGSRMFTRERTLKALQRSISYH